VNRATIGLVPRSTIEGKGHQEDASHSNDARIPGKLFERQSWGDISQRHATKSATLIPVCLNAIISWALHKWMIQFNTGISPILQVRSNNELNISISTDLGTTFFDVVALDNDVNGCFHLVMVCFCRVFTPKLVLIKPWLA